MRVFNDPTGREVGSSTLTTGGDNDELKAVMGAGTGAGARAGIWIRTDVAIPCGCFVIFDNVAS